MAAVRGVIDPALLPGGSETGSNLTTTNGVTSAPITSLSPPARSTRAFSKADLDSWHASSYAPRRDTNETRLEYDERIVDGVTAQHASGNRGDDFRALKLAELQPTELKHPDKRTEIYSVLGMQGEEKAGKRGMRTVINPVYSVFIANLKLLSAPLPSIFTVFTTKRK
ncbi:hypothetical protein B0H17DRAFT_1133058 [Mycena rosella]|uniref:Uncharacterized protein n=1 Tax=Mycena rosella TaxID=1033263 RepID=A0AAD7DIK7_MYCRO|nr:hypothetical protein B0H17DRAFT_1133058 [Mycena rosella]